MAGEEDVSQYVFFSPNQIQIEDAVHFNPNKKKISFIFFAFKLLPGEIFSESCQLFYTLRKVIISRSQKVW